MATTFPVSPDYRPATSDATSAVSLTPTDDGGTIYLTRTAGCAVTVSGQCEVGWRCRLMIASTVTGEVTVAMGTGVTGVSSGVAAPWSMKAGGLVELVMVATGICFASIDSGTGALARVSNTPLGSIALASTGTDATSTAGSIYASDGLLSRPMVSTGAGVLNGTIVGTDKVIYALWDSAGTLLRTTALAGVLSAVADEFQQIAWTSAITLLPGRYWVGFQVEGTTAAHQTIATLTYQNSTTSAAGVFGTIGNLTVVNTKTAGVGPFWYLYT